MAVRVYLRCLDIGYCRTGFSPGGSYLSISSLFLNQATMAYVFWGIETDCPVCPLFPGQIGWTGFIVNRLLVLRRAVVWFQVLCCLDSGTLFFLSFSKILHKTRYQTCLSQKVTNLQQNMQKNKVKWGEQGVHRKKSTQMGYLLSFAKKRTLSFGMQCENAPYYSRQHS